MLKYGHRNSINPLFTDRRFYTLKMWKEREKVADSVVIGRGSTSTYDTFRHTRMRDERAKPTNYTHFIQVFFTQISTTFFRTTTPVYIPVFRTIHTTYNYHYEVNNKER